MRKNLLDVALFPQCDKLKDTRIYKIWQLIKNEEVIF